MGSRKCARLVNIIERLRRDRPELEAPEALVAAARVWVGGVRIDNPRALVRADAPVRIEVERELRGTIKLRAALQRFDVPIAGRIAVDVGASTGGFTVELLARGAARVYAVDAGHGQLLGSLRQDPRVMNLERTNLGALGPALVPDAVEVMTVDLAYLALARAAPQLARLCFSPRADLVALVKPMFELGRGAPPADDASLEAALRSATGAFAAHGWRLLHTMRSPVPGARGAVELFAHARRA